MNFIHLWYSGTRSASRALDPGSNPGGAKILLQVSPPVCHPSRKIENSNFYIFAGEKNCCLLMIDSTTKISKCWKNGCIEVNDFQ